MQATRRLLCVLLAFAAPLAARAQAPPDAQPPPTTDVLAQAREHFERGKAQQREGRYDLAIGSYLASYQLYPLPEMLYNVALAYRLKGDREHALDYYERYLAAEPNGRGAGEARRDSEVLRRELAGRPVATPPPPAGRPALLAPKPPEPARPPPPGRPLRIAGIAVGGLAVIGLVAGLKFATDARALESDVEAEARRAETLGWTPAIDARVAQLIDEGNTAERRAATSFLLGGAAGLASGFLFYLGWRADVDVSAGEGGVAVLVRRCF
jgi:tetratricopeptide (TPR) repeat protein